VILSRIVAGTALAAAVTIGAAGAAFAGTPASTTASRTFSCSAAEARVDQVKTLVAVVKARLSILDARHDRLVAAGMTMRADALKARIDLIKARLASVDVRLDKVEAAIAVRCASTPSNS